MTINLSKPFSWRNPPSADHGVMLEQLQPNILKAHARDHLTVLLLKFAETSGARLFLAGLCAQMKSAAAHLLEVDAFKSSGVPGSPYVGVGISSAGYVALGVPDARRPKDAAFRSGMRNASLGDPPRPSWDGAYQDEIHAIVLVGDSSESAKELRLAGVRSLIAAAQGAVIVLGEEIGRGLTNGNGDGIEHFGYVDGRSQPLFLAEDIDEERQRRDGATNWDPAFAPSRAITPDPAAPAPKIHFGSYFVFRKLEQNVDLFKKEEAKLAAALGLFGAEAERAGALLVGRFEDGTPLAVQGDEGAHAPVMNDFTYDSDAAGGKCPHFAHIRKVNPRGSGGFESHADERLHIMARRGQTYGRRKKGLKDRPKKNVGLLFMAFNVDIGEQFEFAQSTWANNPNFPKANPAPGLDHVIGQGARPAIRCPKIWGAAAPGEFQGAAAPQQAVTMKGGEYFFMPSLAFLRSLGATAAPSSKKKSEAKGRMSKPEAKARPRK